MMSREDGHKADFLMSKEGVKQGNPLSKILYGIGMLPLMKLIKMRSLNVYNRGLWIMQEQEEVLKT